MKLRWQLLSCIWITLSLPYESWQVLDIETRYEMTKFEGEYAELKCESHTGVVVTFRWIKHSNGDWEDVYSSVENTFRSPWDQMFGIKQANLFINNLTTSFSGTYRCVNIEDPMIISEINLSVRKNGQPTLLCPPVECPTTNPVSCVCPTIPTPDSTTPIPITTTTTPTPSTTTIQVPPMKSERKKFVCEGDCVGEKVMCEVHVESVNCWRENLTCDANTLKSVSWMEVFKWTDVLQGALIIVVCLIIVGLVGYVISLKRNIRKMNHTYLVPLREKDEYTQNCYLPTYDFIPDYEHLKSDDNKNRELPEIPDYVEVIAS